MSLGAWGAVLGAGAGLRAVLLLQRLVTWGRPDLAVRVLPYLRDL